VTSAGTAKRIRTLLHTNNKSVRGGFVYSYLFVVIKWIAVNYCRFTFRIIIFVRMLLEDANLASAPWSSLAILSSSVSLLI
jgi:hypothetical protein